MRLIVACCRNFVLLLLLALIIGSSCASTVDPLIFSTSGCFLTEPVYGHNFDFSALRSDFGHLATSDKGDIFDYNICGNLAKTCDGRRDVAACLKRGNKEIVLGTQHQLNYKEGRMYFEFSNGAACPSGGHYQLHVFLVCDYTLDKNQSQVTSYSGDACSFYITLETPLACLPEPDAVKSNTCSVKDPHTGFIYDLMPLSDANYRTSDHKGSAFVINVCKPVLYGANAMCPFDSSVCFIALNATDYKKKYFNYGTVQANPVLENGKLLMRQPSSTPCNTTHNITSTIYFFCDEDVKIAEPKFIGSNGCEYAFSFTTPLACSSLVPCTVLTQRNEIYDMTSLQNKSFTLEMQEKNYTFAVCGNAGAPCLESDGSCFTSNSQSTSLGISNSRLRFNQFGSPYLLYEGGASCQKSDATAPPTSWSTRIEFVCANNTTATTTNATKAVATASLGPKIIENSDCQLLIHYQTELACREQIACKARVYVEHTEDGTGEEVVDLTPLISTTENYVARIDASMAEQQDTTSQFFINVCRPLVPKFGLGCPGGSAACMAKAGGSTPKNEKSLGFPLASLVARNRTNAELRYLEGGACPTDNDSQLSSGIEFYCDVRAGRGGPILKSIIDCHYQFAWPTNVICPAHLCNFDAASCEIINDEISERYSLRSAPYTDAGHIKINESSKAFSIDICSGELKAWTDYAQATVNVYFSAPRPCGDGGKVNVQMQLICNHENESATTFSDDSRCSLIYTQRTSHICKFLGINIPATTTIATTTTEISSNDKLVSSTATPNSEAAADAANHSLVGVILAGILSLTFFITCLGFVAFSPGRRNRLRRCFRYRHRSVRYTRVQSNEEANLLLEPNGHFTDSDDDMLL